MQRTLSHLTHDCAEEMAHGDIDSAEAVYDSDPGPVALGDGNSGRPNSARHCGPIFQAVDLSRGVNNVEGKWQ